MDPMFSILLWGALIYLATRSSTSQVAGSECNHVPIQMRIGETSANEVRWVPPEKDIDCVCNETVTTEKAKSSVYDGRVFYFCSRECREVFEAAPSTYLTPHR